MEESVAEEKPHAENQQPGTLCLQNMQNLVVPSFDKLPHKTFNKQLCIYHFSFSKVI